MSPVKLFENKKVRAQWDEAKQQWYFSIVDVAGGSPGGIDRKEA